MEAAVIGDKGLEIREVPRPKPGKISVPIDRTSPLDEAAAAQAHVRANAQFGKIVLSVDY